MFNEDFFNHMKDLLKDDILENVCGNKLEIVENKNELNNDKKEKHQHYLGGKLIIKGIKNSLVIDLEKDNRTIYFLKQDTKINDKTIIYSNADNIIVNFIELKSNKESTAKKQIVASKAYIDFMFGLIKDKIKCDNFNIEFRGFIFSTNSKARIQTTRRGMPKSEKYCGINIYRYRNNNKKEYHLSDLVRID